MASRAKRYVVCLSNRGYPASLERRKIYVVLPDAEADRRGLLRVVDESGDDYLFPKTRFAEIALTREIEKAISR